MKIQEALEHIRNTLDDQDSDEVAISRHTLTAIVEALPIPEGISETSNVYVAPNTGDNEMDAMMAILIVLRHVDNQTARQIARYIMQRTWSASAEGEA